MIFDWDDPIAFGSLSYVMDWDVVRYGVYVFPTIERTDIASFPNVAYFAAADVDDGIVPGIPLAVYETGNYVADSSNLAIPFGYPIGYHDGSTLTFHDGSHVSFHGYTYPEITRQYSVPRQTYSGNVE